MKMFWRRLGAWALVISMLLPLAAVTGTPTLAAEAPKPELFVDFLGDNWTSSTYDGVLHAPQGTDQGENGTKAWDLYDESESAQKPIFWIGVGINNMAAFELAKGSRGLSSVELGFYYNDEFVEPYTGNDFAVTLANYNLADSNTRNQWDRDDYEIVGAVADARETGGSIRQMLDPDTQEYAPAATWKLAHVSLRKKANAAGANRFAGFNASDATTQYIMMIPFQVKKYDSNRALCFTLTRSASLLSIGGGTSGYTLGSESNAASSYGAWERETLNPGHNLKDMLAFTGDLNIFTGKKSEEQTYHATLVAVNPQSGFDSAVLYRSNDPLTPRREAKVEYGKTTDTLEGLYSYTDMTLQVASSASTTVVVTVQGTVNGTLPVSQDPDDPGKYTFQMPNNPAEDVTVRVQFYASSSEASYRATLEIVDPDDVAGNKATLKNTANGKTTSDSGTSLEVVSGTGMKVLTEVDPDYDVKVEVVAVAPISVTTETARKEYGFQMPAANVTVRVTYTKAELHGVHFLVDASSTVSGGDANNRTRLGYRAWAWDPTDEDQADSWEKTTATLNGRDGGTDDSISVRDGRELTVGINLAPGYKARVVMKPDGGEEAELTLTNVGTESFPWSAVFDMPNSDVEVKVYFIKVDQKNVKAVAKDANTAEYPLNSFTITATDEIGTYWGYSNPAGEQQNNFDVMAGTTVTVKLNNDPNYQIKEVHIIKVTRSGDTVTDGDEIVPQGSIINGTLTFETPSDPSSDVEVRVVYQAGAANKLNATLTVQNDGGAVDKWWNDEGLKYTGATLVTLEGNALEADIEVASGWHIASVEVRGATDTYDYVLSGNGWNNGGTGTVTESIKFTMPGEDVTVYVLMKEGPPDETPSLTAELQVNDPDNTTNANNWAKIQVNSKTPQPSAGVKKSSNNPYSTAVETGNKITVTFGAAAGYHVDSVTLGPSGAGPITWVDSNTVTYTQGAVSTCVTVNFKAGDPVEHTATLHQQEADGDDKATLTDHTDAGKTTTVNKDVSTGSVNALAGTTLDLSASAGEGRYVVAAYAMRGGTMLPLTPAFSSQQPFNGSFAMPDGDVDVYVKFSATAPDPNDHTVVLTVTDLSATAETQEGDAGKATLSADGIASVEVKSEADPGVATVRKGKLVTVSIEPKTEDGYSIDSVILSSGETVTLDRPDTRTATFIMPDGDVGVEVRLKKGEPTKYTADIILRAPDGVSAQDAGDAWFEGQEKGIYSLVAEPGTGLKVNVAAKPGYYLESVTVTPVALGIAPPITGTFGQESVSFAMPPAHVYINVTFKAGWPDDAEFNATLQVEGPASSGAAILSNTETDRTSDTGEVKAGDPVKSVAARDSDSMAVELKPAAGYTVDTISITDPLGVAVPYHYTGAGKIAFDMPGSDALVKVTYKAGDPTTHKALLRYDSSEGDSATIKNSVTSESTNDGVSGEISGNPGDLIQIVGRPSPGHQMYAVFVTGADGTDIPLLTPIRDNGDGTFSTSVAMQDQDIIIEPIFVGDLPVGEFPAFLRLAGPNDAGTGTITANSVTESVTTCPGISKYVKVPHGDTVEVNATANPGFAIDTVTVTGADGTNLSYTWTGAGQLSFVMPSQAATAVVTFRKEERTEFTAQVVIDDGGSADNKAVLYRDVGTPSTADDGVSLLTAKPGEKLYLNIHPATGYQAELVMVTPAKYGVTVQSITLPNIAEQDGTFYMPAGDIQVFVRFRKDTLERHWATLKATHATGVSPDSGNKASIHSAYSGEKGEAYDGDPTTYQVLAAKTELVTVKAKTQTGYWAEVVVKDTGGNSVSGVSVTQIAADKWQFPMPNVDVVVTVVFHTGDRPSNRAYLHLIDAGGSATLKAGSAVTSVDMGYIEVAAMDTVTLTAQAASGYYIKDAYVQYGASTLACDPNGMENVSTTFLMQNGEVHVYVVFANTTKPDSQVYTGVLTVTDLSEPPGGEGTAGEAVMKTSDANSTGTVKSAAKTTYTVTGSDPVETTTTPTHGRIAATPGDTVTVLVTIQPGYRIDGVILTPAAYGITPTVRMVDASNYEYTFTMPEHNVGMEVQLTRGTSDGFYSVTLHYLDRELTDDKPASGSRGTVIYSNQTVTKNGESLLAPEEKDVTIEVKPAVGYYVKKAYAVSGTEMLQLSCLLENVFTPGGGTPSVTSAIFAMPAGNVDVYVEFELLVNQPEQPEKREHTIAFVMTDPSGLTVTGNKGVMTRADGTTKIEVTANGPHDRLNAYHAEEMTIELTLPNDLYAVDKILVTPAPDGGVEDITFVKDAENEKKYTFSMPDRDVMVHITLKAMERDIYSVTLKIDDQSSAIGNTAKMTVGSKTVTGDGAKIEKLYGNEHVTVNALLQPGVKVAGAAVYRPNTGSTEIIGTESNTKFEVIMTQEDVVITLVLTDEDDNLFVAQVTKVDPNLRPGNTASITNTGEPTQSRGEIWTAAHPGSLLRVDFATEANYYAQVTAVDGNGNPVSCAQQGTTGTGYALFTMPSASLNIQVTYTTEDPFTDPMDMVLAIAGDYGAWDDNTATLTKDTSSVTAKLGDTPKTLSGMTVSDELNLTTACHEGYYVEKATVTAGGVSYTLPLTGGTGTVQVPAGGGTVTVYFASGTRTARPYDPAYATPTAPGTQEGHLVAQNPGNNKVEITVPNLYDGTTPLLAATADETYTLYWWDGGAYRALTRGTDYEIVVPVTAYSHDPYTGVTFSIRSLKGDGALTDAIAHGGVLYITATSPTGAESEYTELVIPEDIKAQNKEYTATLKIVDNSGVAGNKARMEAAGTVVNYSGAKITGLAGDELVRTEATPAADVRVSAVTATDSGGTRLLSYRLDEGGTDLWYPYDMTGEDVLITVYFERNVGPTRYVAAVALQGFAGVDGNGATIRNDTRSDLSKGDIWAEGYENNDMKVTVSLADDYYATVEAFNVTTGTSMILPVTGGPGGTFDVLLTMPASDVQVKVTYIKTAPSNLFKLTLELDGYSDTDTAEAKEKKDEEPITLSVNGTDGTTAVASVEAVPAGTVFDLTATHAEEYYIEKVVQYFYDANGTQLSTTGTITLSDDGKGTFTMPYSESKVVVYYKQGAQMSRPFDPEHKTVASPADDPATQEGYLTGEPQDNDENGHRRVQIMVPVLLKKVETDPETLDKTYTYTDADHDTVPSSVGFKLYRKDSYGTYHELVVGTDISISGEDYETAYVKTPASGDTPAVNFRGRKLTVTALDDDGVLAHYIKDGGVIYITAVDDRPEPGDGDPALDPPRKAESAYTEVVLPANQSATLKVVGVSTDTESVATTQVGTDGPSVTAKTGESKTLSGLGGSETLKTTVTPDTNVVKSDVKVVAEAAGKAQLLKEESGTYDYWMDGEDVTITAILQDKDDTKDWYIATIEKNRNGADSEMPESNTATVRDQDSSVPPYGDLWSAAYSEDKMLVTVNTEIGWYAQITVRTVADTPEDVPFVQWAASNAITAEFTMPASDVLITVLYSDAPFDDMDGKLTLKVDKAGGNSENWAKIAIDGVDTLAVNGDDPTQQATDTNVATGATLTLTTHAQANRAVAKVDLVTSTGGTLTTYIDLDATGGATLPMPRGDATITVIYGDQTGRPYDPMNSEKHNTPDYAHNGEEDLSSTHQEGWLLADRKSTGATQATVTIPTLWQYNSGAEGNYELVSADSHTFDFYLLVHDDVTDTDSYIKLQKDVDYTISGETTGAYYSKDTNLKGTKFVLGEVAGGALEDTLSAGLSLYVTATKKPVEGEDPWGESERTELVIPAYDATGLRPYDPANTPSKDPYQEFWITSENRGDSLIVTVPVLFDGDAFSSVVWTESGIQDSFRFYMGNVNEDPIDLSAVIRISHPDTSTAHAEPIELVQESYTDPADNTKKYDGAKFVVTILSNAEIDAAISEDAAEAERQKGYAGRLRDVVEQNHGTGDGAGQERLYITVVRTIPSAVDGEDPSVEVGTLVDFEVPRYYSLVGILESYAPRHETKFSFYPVVGAVPDDTDGKASYLADDANYADEPALVFTDSRTRGSGLWQLDFALKSSKLMGDDRTGMTWKLVIEKPGHVPFTWLGLELFNYTLDDPSGVTFTLSTLDDENNAVVPEIIKLWGGDVDADGHVTTEDYAIVMRYFEGAKHSRLKPENADSDAEKWAISLWNPTTMEHRADVDGDGFITMNDVVIIMGDRDLGKSSRDNVEVELKSSPVTPAVYMLSFETAEESEEEQAVTDYEDLTVDELEVLLSEAEDQEQREQITARIAQLTAPEERASEQEEISVEDDKESDTEKENVEGKEIPVESEEPTEDKESAGEEEPAEGEEPIDPIDDEDSSEVKEDDGDEEPAEGEKLSEEKEAPIVSEKPAEDEEGSESEESHEGVSPIDGEGISQSVGEEAAEGEAPVEEIPINEIPAPEDYDN